MKKILAFTLLLLCLLSALVSCRDVESEEGIVGVWRSEELSTNEKISQRMIYAFAPNGHMLSIDVYADQITSVVGAHYAYDEAGVLSITQYGKDDGKMNADLSGDTLVLSVYFEEGVEVDEELSGKKLTFTRENAPKEGAFVGYWMYAYRDENDKVIQIRYNF